MKFLAHFNTMYWVFMRKNYKILEDIERYDLMPAGLK